MTGLTANQSVDILPRPFDHLFKYWVNTGCLRRGWESTLYQIFETVDITEDFY